MKADPQWDRARAAAAKRGWHMPNNLACRADCEALATAWFGDEVAELRTLLAAARAHMLGAGDGYENEVVMAISAALESNTKT